MNLAWPEKKILSKQRQKDSEMQIRGLCAAYACMWYAAEIESLHHLMLLFEIALNDDTGITVETLVKRLPMSLTSVKAEVKRLRIQGLVYTIKQAKRYGKCYGIKTTAYGREVLGEHIHYLEKLTRKEKPLTNAIRINLWCELLDPGTPKKVTRDRRVYPATPRAVLETPGDPGDI